MSTSINIFDLLKRFSLHRGGAAEGLITKLVAAGPDADPWQLRLSNEEQRLLGHVIAVEAKTPDAEEVQSAVACLARRRLSHKLELINRKLALAEEQRDAQAVEELLLLKRIAHHAAALLEVF